MDEQAKNCREILQKNNLHPIKRIGRGGFSLVFLVQRVQLSESDSQLMAAKCVSRKQFIKRPSLQHYVAQEIITWRTLSHVNLVKLVRTFEDEDWIFMLMEYCNAGTLYEAHKKQPNYCFPKDTVLGILRQVIRGVAYLHDQNLIHRDIKAENILLHSVENTSSPVVKVCDLGFVREDDTMANTFCGTTHYMAPQILARRKYDSKVDVWALGVLMYYMLFGEFPFRGLNIEHDISIKCSKGFSLKAQKLKPNSSLSSSDMDSLHSLFKRIFSIDPKNRLTIKQMQESKWVKAETGSRETTVQSEGSEQDAMFDIEKCKFLRAIEEEVRGAGFLSPLEEYAFRFHINKMVMIILGGRKDKQVERVVEEISRQNSEYGHILTMQRHKVPIGKFEESYQQNSFTFREIKECYRIVIGHIFSKTHKCITNDLGKRSRLKTKLFCWHVINRAFESQHRGVIFPYYYSWLRSQKSPPHFDFSSFEEWIELEQPQKLVQTVELMNNRFYRKSIH